MNFATLFAPVVVLALMFALDRVERWLADSDSVAQPGRVIQLITPPRQPPDDVPSRRVT